MVVLEGGGVLIGEVPLYTPQHGRDARTSAESASEQDLDVGPWALRAHTEAG